MYYILDGIVPIQVPANKLQVLALYFSKKNQTYEITESLLSAKKAPVSSACNNFNLGLREKSSTGFCWSACC